MERTLSENAAGISKLREGMRRYNLQGLFGTLDTYDAVEWVSDLEDLFRNLSSRTNQVLGRLERIRDAHDTLANLRSTDTQTRFAVWTFTTVPVALALALAPNIHSLVMGGAVSAGLFAYFKIRKVLEIL